MIRRELNPEVVKRIKNDLPLQGKIAEAVAKYRAGNKPLSPATMNRYLAASNPMLTMPEAVGAIMEHYGLTEDEVVITKEMTDKNAQVL